MVQLGKYQVLRKLACGGMAEVFLARSTGPMGFEKTVVVKRILPHLAKEPQFVEMFLSEARLAARLNHSNVVQIFDFGEDAGTYFIAMEFIDGPNLRTLCQRSFEAGSPIPFALCARILCLACQGLSYAHELRDPETSQPLNLVHRDISTDNILLSRHGEVKVVDFGIAKAVTQVHRTMTGAVKGKLAYMPPEQLEAMPLDLRADVYALGVVLYELVTGRKPFEGESDAQLMRAILFEPLLPPRAHRANTPEALERILQKALARRREDRYSSCRELQADLERFLLAHGEPVSMFELAELVQRLAPPGSGEIPDAALSSGEAAAPATTPCRPVARRVKTELWAPGSKEPTEKVPSESATIPRAQPRKAALAALAGALLLLGAGGSLTLGRFPRVAQSAPTPASPAKQEAPLPSEPAAKVASPSLQEIQQTGTEELASVELHSVPTGTLRVNGKRVGVSPQRVRVPPGLVRVEVSGKGFSKEETFRLAPGDNGRRTLKVRKTTLSILVHPDPEEVELTLDGEFLGTEPPPLDVYEGKHRLQVADRETHQVLTTKDCFANPDNPQPCKYIAGK